MTEKRCVCAITLLVALAGCGVSEIVTPVTIISSKTPLPSVPVPTTIPTPSLAKPTVTALPSPTSKPPTLTPVPTMTVEEEQALVLDLLSSNAGCRLPCWWGFTPGQTLWNVVETFFISLGKYPVEYGDSRSPSYVVQFGVPQHGMRIGLTYNTNNGIIEMVSIGTSIERDERIVYGDVQFSEDWQMFMLPQFLMAYGHPDQVLLWASPFPWPDGWLPFELFLYYPEQGILVRYRGPIERGESMIRICPQHMDIALWLWPPGRVMTLEDIAREGEDLFLEEIPEIRPIEEVTEMTVEQFYQMFVQLDNQACFETPADLWPK